LLVVIAIIAVLAALLLPSLKSSRDLARRIQCLSSIRQFGLAVKIYVNENGVYPPTTNHGQTAPDLATVLTPTFMSAIPVCPSLRLTAQARAGGNTEAKWGSYGLNKYLMQCGNPPDPMWSTRVGPIPYPDDSKMPMILETGGLGSTWAWTHQYQALNGVYGAFKITEGRNHGRGDMLNFVFVDGHAECISRNDPRPLDEADKSWLYPANPNGAFEVYGRYGKFASHSQLNAAQYDAAFP
jgi:prepilin-type processing-associated H-X9-DG protein